MFLMKIIKSTDFNIEDFVSSSLLGVENSESLDDIKEKYKQKTEKLKQVEKQLEENELVDKYFELSNSLKYARANKAIKIDPEYALSYYNRGLAYKRLGKLQEAINDYSTSIQLDPSNYAAYINRGITRENIGDLKGACADWRKASSLGQKDAAGWVRKQCQ